MAGKNSAWDAKGSAWEVKGSAAAAKALGSMSARMSFQDPDNTVPPPHKGIFVDAVAMKEKMRAQLAKPEYDVRNFYYTTGIAAGIARSAWFDKISLGVIAFNAVWISVDTDYNDATVLTEAEWPFQAADHFFCCFFFLEWIIRFLAFARKRNGLRDAWFCFDFMMVVMMVMETWVMTVVLYFMDVDGGGMGNAGVFKLIRLTRLTRMARMARLLRAMPELLVLLKGMWAATRSVFFTLLLLFIIIYVFGIVFTQMTGGSEIGEELFYSVPASMHTLLLHGTLMDEMSDVVNGLGEGSPYFPVVFYLFLLISALTVMNMLIGVLCEVVAAVAATEKEESSVAYVKWQIRDIMKKGGLDLDGDGMISKEEFVKILDNAQATRTLNNAGVDVFGLVDCADFIFGDEEEDTRGSCMPAPEPVQLSFADFMEVVLQLRGTNVATVKDLVDLRKFLTVTTKKLDEKVAKIGKQCDNIGKEVGACVTEVSKGSWSSKGKSDDRPRDGHDFAHWKMDSEGSSVERNSPPALPDKASERRAWPGSPEQVLPQETCVGVPQAHQVDVVSAPVAVIVPSVASAFASAGAALKSNLFDQINGELDQLRQYVDIELTAIMQDLRVMSQHPGISRHEPLQAEQSNLPVRLPNIDASIPDLPQDAKSDLKAQYDNERIQVPETLSMRTGSSAMCPGAELRCLGGDKRKQATCGL